MDPDNREEKFISLILNDQFSEASRFMAEHSIDWNKKVKMYLKHPEQSPCETTPFLVVLKGGSSFDLEEVLRVALANKFFIDINNSTYSIVDEFSDSEKLAKIILCERYRFKLACYFNDLNTVHEFLALQYFPEIVDIEHIRSIWEDPNMGKEIKELVVNEVGRIVDSY